MSLLTDMSIKAILVQTQYTAKGHPFPSDRQPLLKARAVADASQTATLKAAAEWGAKDCQNGLHSEENIIVVRQIECPDCQDELLEAAAKGKMPGEE